MIMMCYIHQPSKQIHTKATIETLEQGVKQNQGCH